ncbi:MAG: EamA family transporter [Rhodospirillales bacterium]|nr:MAG: EamA family transporter [Rhodospirillales bacterium]
MALQAELVFLVLLAALAHAGWNTVVKSSGTRNRTFAVMLLAGGAVGLAGAILLPLPAPAAWPYLVVSAVVHFLYYGFLLLAYRHGDLSHVYPLARGAAPLAVATGAWLMAGEALPLLGILGLALASAGLMSLAFENGVPRGDAGKPVVYALGTGLLIAAYTVVDGLGVRASRAPLSYIVWLNLLEAVPIVLWLAIRRPQDFVRRTGPWWRHGLIGGLLATTAYGLIIYAMSAGGMAHVSALRETSTLFAALIGTLILGERRARPVRRIAAAAMVSAGIVALQLA